MNIKSAELVRSETPAIVRQRQTIEQFRRMSAKMRKSYKWVPLSLFIAADPISGSEVWNGSAACLPVLITHLLRSVAGTLMTNQKKSAAASRTGRTKGYERAQTKPSADAAVTCRLSSAGRAGCRSWVYSALSADSEYSCRSPLSHARGSEAVAGTRLSPHKSREPLETAKERSGTMSLIKACADCELEQGILGRADAGKSHGLCERHFQSFLREAGCSTEIITRAVSEVQMQGFCPDLQKVTKETKLTPLLPSLPSGDFPPLSTLNDSASAGSFGATAPKRSEGGQPSTINQ